MDVLEKHYFSQQFLISRQNLAFFYDRPHMTSWRKWDFADGLSIFCHPELTVSHASDNQSELICLGDILDPDNVAASNGEITATLTREVNDFSGLETRLSRMAGRWVIVTRFRNALFLYHDAGGLKSVFLYTDHQQHTAYAASQFARFGHIFSLHRLTERDDEITRTGTAQWPLYVYPYGSCDTLSVKVVVA